MTNKIDNKELSSLQVAVENQEEETEEEDINNKSRNGLLRSRTWPTVKELNLLNSDTHSNVDIKNGDSITKPDVVESCCTNNNNKYVNNRDKLNILTASNSSTTNTSICSKNNINNRNNIDIPALLVLDPRKSETLNRHYYPEGGWGWLVLLSVVLVNFLSHGLQLSFSILVTLIQNKFNVEVLAHIALTIMRQTSISSAIENNIGYSSGFNIANPSLCYKNGLNLTVIILITSAPSHFKARNNIRLTWGKLVQQYNITMAFVIGLNKTFNEEIYNESVKYNDIIQTHFNDSYTNLTYKTISMLEWVNSYCYNVKFILKTDDDIFVNVPKILQFLSEQNDTQRYIYGNLYKNSKPYRKPSSKYYVSFKEYNKEFYPPYTDGKGYILPGIMVNDLYIEALKTTAYFKFEDVFITGIIAGKLNITIKHYLNFLPVTVNNKTQCVVNNKFTVHLKGDFQRQFECFINYELNKMFDKL